MNDIGEKRHKIPGARALGFTCTATFSDEGAGYGWMLATRSWRWICPNDERYPTREGARQAMRTFILSKINATAAHAAGVNA